LLLLAWAIVPGSAPTAGKPSLYVAPAGSDSARCTQPSPCRSFDRAYHRARPGQTVFVQGGRYSEQDISFDPAKKSSADVVFRPTSQANVYVSDVTINARHVEVRDISTHVLYAGSASNPVASDVTFRNVNTDTFFITGASNVRVLGGDVGPIATSGPEIKACYHCATPPRNILVSGVTFHDITRTGSTHVAGLHILQGDGITVRRSRFVRTSIIDLEFNQYNGVPVKNILVENNFFAEPPQGGHYALELSSNDRLPIVNALVRYNSAAATMWVDNCCGLRNVRMVGNVGHRLSYHCYDGVVFSYNVWDGARCSATDRRASLGFRNAAAGDLHLLPRAFAINHGDPKSYPRVDIDGQRRAKGRRPDAGADEVR
jgi:hypothetical protein